MDRQKTVIVTARSMGPVPTIGALLKAAQTDLGASETGCLDAEVLLGIVLGIGRAELYRSPEKPVAPDLEARFKTLVAERRGGIPTAYLSGHREFWSLDLRVNTATLIPRPETEHLVENALKIMSREQIRMVADLGTGSGALAISIASEHPASWIAATDVSIPALLVAKDNAARLGLKNVRFACADWLAGFRTGLFDLIVSNPPYVASGDPCLAEGEPSFEPKIALDGGPDGLSAMRRIVPQISSHLRPGGWLILEHGHEQRVPIEQLIRRHGLDPIQGYSDYSGHPRGIVAQLNGIYRAQRHER